LYLKQELVLQVLYDSFYKISDSHAFIVEKDGKKGLYTGYKNDYSYEYTGIRELLPIDYDEITVDESDYEGQKTYYIVKKGKLIGVFDGEKRFVIPFEFKKIDFDRKNELDFGVYEFGTVYKIEVQRNKTKGLFIFGLKPEYSPIFLSNYLPISSESYIFICKNDKNLFGVVNLSIAGEDKFTIPSQYEEIREFEDYYFAVKKDGKWGVLSQLNDVVLEIKYLNFSDLKIE